MVATGRYGGREAGGRHGASGQCPARVGISPLQTELVSAPDDLGLLMETRARAWGATLDVSLSGNPCHQL